MLAFDVSSYRRTEKSPSGDVARNEQLLRGYYDELLMLWTVRAEPSCLGWIKLQGAGYPMLYVADANAIVDGALDQVDVSREMPKSWRDAETTRHSS